MTYKLALVNAIADIRTDLNEIKISNGIGYINNIQIGKIIKGGQLSGIPEWVDYPKDILNLKGTGNIIDSFEFGYNNIKRIGVVIEFIPEKKKSDVIKKDIVFELEENIYQQNNYFFNKNNTKLYIKNKIFELEVLDNNKKIAHKEIKEINDNIPDCTGTLKDIIGKTIIIEVEYSDKTDKYENENYKNNYYESLNSIKKEIFDYLNNKIEIFFINKIFTTYEDYGNDKILIPKPKKLYIGENNYIKIALTSILRGKHLLLSGPKSTGKNVFVETLAWILQRPLYKESVSIATDEYKIIGSPSLINVKNEDGTISTITSYSERSLITSMKKGFIYLLDEVNSADSGLLTCFHSVTDDSKSYFLPSGEKVVSNKNFFVIATMNEGYTGTNELNPAFIDRFVNLKFYYFKEITPILEQGRCKKISKDLSLKLEAIYNEIASNIECNNLDENCISIRAFIDVVDLIEDGISFEEAFEIALINRTDKHFNNRLKAIIETFK